MRDVIATGDLRSEASHAPASGWGMRLRHSILNPHYIMASRLQASLTTLIGQAPVGRCVDIGCGQQPYRSLVVARQYVGFDVLVSGRPASLKHPDAWFDGRSIPVRDGAVDLALCTEVLEHTPDPQRLVTEAARILKPGGRLILTAPQTWGLHEAPHDYFRYTILGLRLLCERAGMVVRRGYALSGLGGTLAQRLAAYVFYRYGGRALWRKAMVAAVLCAPIQAVGLLLDFVWGHTGDPLGHAIEAVKP